MYCLSILRDYDLSCHSSKKKKKKKTLLLLYSQTPEKSLRIKIFQYSGWVNENEEPPAAGLITLIAKVEKWQQHSGNGPITVVCRLVGVYIHFHIHIRT